MLKTFQYLRANLTSILLVILFVLLLPIELLAADPQVTVTTTATQDLSNKTLIDAILKGGTVLGPNSTIRFGNALATQPCMVVSSLPVSGSFQIGDCVFLSTAAPGLNLYAVTSLSPLTWSLQSGTGGGGGGTITAVGNCVAGNCFQTAGIGEVFKAPPGGGIAAFSVLTDTDIPNTITLDNLTQITTRNYADLQNKTHVLAGTAGLGPDHSVTGLTVGQYLGATSPTGAGFKAIQDADLPATILRTSRQILTGAGLSGGGDLSVDRTLSVVADTTTQRIEIAKNGALVGSARKQVNLIEGANITFVIADNAGSNRMDVTIVGAAGGAGSGHTIMEDGAALAQRSKLNIIGTSSTCTDNAGVDQTDCLIQAYNRIQLAGSNLTQRTTVNILGNTANCVDNSGSTRTDCTFSVDQALAYAWTGTHSFKDTLFSILNTADPTKIVKWDLTNQTTGTTRTYSGPNASTRLWGDSDFSGVGTMFRTGSGAGSVRVLTGTVNKITVSPTDGSANPVFNLAAPVDCIIASATTQVLFNLAGNCTGSSGLTFSAGILTATAFSGPLTGNIAISTGQSTFTGALLIPVKTDPGSPITNELWRSTTSPTGLKWYDGAAIQRALKDSDFAGSSHGILNRTGPGTYSAFDPTTTSRMLVSNGTDFVLTTILSCPGQANSWNSGTLSWSCQPIGGISGLIADRLSKALSPTSIGNSILNENTGVLEVGCGAGQATCLFGMDTSVFASSLKTWGFPANISATFVGRVAGGGGFSTGKCVEWDSNGNAVTAVSNAGCAIPFVDRSTRVYNNANISIANGTATALTFNSERYDTDTMHSTGSNTGRITFTTGGKYSVSGTLNFATGGGSVRQAYITLNGSTIIALVSVIPTTGGADTAVVISTDYNFSAADYVELFVYQDSGGSLNVTSNGNLSPEFMAHKFN